VEQGQTAEKQEPIAACLAKALGVINEAVRPMGGEICPKLKMSTGIHGFQPYLKIAISFSAEDLYRYMSQSSLQAQCTAHTSGGE